MGHDGSYTKSLSKEENSSRRKAFVAELEERVDKALQMENNYEVASALRTFPNKDATDCANILQTGIEDSAWNYSTRLYNHNVGNNIGRWKRKSNLKAAKKRLKAKADYTKRKRSNKKSKVRKLQERMGSRPPNVRRALEERSKNSIGYRIRGNRSGILGSTAASLADYLDALAVFESTAKPIRGFFGKQYFKQLAFQRDSKRRRIFQRMANRMGDVVFMGDGYGSGSNQMKGWNKNSGSRPPTTAFTNHLKRCGKTVVSVWEFRTSKTCSACGSEMHNPEVWHCMKGEARHVFNNRRLFEWTNAHATQVRGTATGTESTKILEQVSINIEIMHNPTLLTRNRMQNINGSGCANTVHADEEEAFHATAGDEPVVTMRGNSAGQESFCSTRFGTDIRGNPPAPAITRASAIQVQEHKKCLGLCVCPNVDCRVMWNRDTNAARNILLAGWWTCIYGVRPEHLRPR